MRLEALALASLLWATGPARAQWVHTLGEDNPFQGGRTHLAMTFDFSGFAAMFRCTSAQDLALLLITPEKPQPDQLRAVRQMPAEMLVIVDQNPRRRLDAEVDATPNWDNYRMTAMGPDVAVLLHQASAGRQRIALAGQLAGKPIWTQAFGLAGSRRALQPLISGCKIELKPSG